ncbi:glyoxalase [Rhodococcus qingshengii]|uniref:VOC family protein n=1 Tax=Rhodococcus qingshengii TaxID=334542 RepID=UPI0007E55C48|nr:VOC family protein [Rhodococcus qingshengii]BCF83305.1 glyoxalase [Rhodococcus qingshengii]
MSYTGFGRSNKGVFQLAYVVEDFDAAIDIWVTQHGVGPWFTMTGFTGIDPLYRGETTNAAISVAMAFSGTMCLELIATEDDQPSVWKDHVDRHGYGFHHFGKLTTSFDEDVARYAEDGHELVYQTAVPTGGRLGFIDTTNILPGYQELIEVGEVTDPMFTQLYAAALTWDGKDPVRPIG